ncbi:MAG: MoxR family ATPase [Planctomycetota bacterium]|nr:MAG: MoxR family ATPase [Planctomycetota bacterium]REJ96693.1 MAG: MoxR family ATPase [Planctomycetota bacterium]REK22294.1 MAG: MoxR family ATPase [Planctomycetota bacterium]REK41077.1 MAG: MoxR family ATPase [Planctomycetota bacterium]
MATEMQNLVAELEANICRVVLGKPEVVRLCTVALLAGEHVLLEDVPGVGKTLIGKALAKSVSGDFCRIQFTPDLLPSDITGGSVYQAQTGEFKYVPGPVFANIILADEINRTTPRTQSALLEAMSDRQVSVDGQSHPLPEPFMVIATQNPFEFEGTYPLPESQLDRFLMRIAVGYPSREDELQVLTSHRGGEPVDALQPVLSSEDIVSLQARVREVRVDETIHDYLLDLIEATRTSEELQVGASTRATLCLYRASQGLALVEGRDFVIPDDVKRLAIPVLSHRVLARGYLNGSQRDAIEAIIERLVDGVAIPG